MKISEKLFKNSQEYAYVKFKLIYFVVWFSSFSIPGAQIKKKCFRLTLK